MSTTRGARVVLQCAVPLSLRPLPSRSRALACRLATRPFAAGAHGFPFGGFGGGPPRGDSEKFYKLLGVDKGASDKDLKQAYKKLAMKHHPDRGGDEDTFKTISRAYEVLTNPEKRQIYDQYGEEGLANMEQGTGGPQPGMDPFDLFSQIFGFQAGGGGRRGRPTTPDSTYELQLSLEELYTGTSRNIVFTRDAICGDCNGEGGHDKKQCSRCGGSGQQIRMQQMGLFVQQVQTPCSACGGKGSTIPQGKICKTCKGKCTVKEKNTFNIDVEPGCQQGTEFRFRGQADEAPGHDTGDVVIVIKEKTHKAFQRVRDGLMMSKKLSLKEALCGFQFSTPFLDGEELVVQSRPGQVVKPNDVMVVEGKGMPRPHGPHGDLIILMDVEFPDSIPTEEREQLLGIFGGERVPDEPPVGAAVPRVLNPRQREALKQKLREGRQEARQRTQGHQEAQCVHQ